MDFLLNLFSSDGFMPHGFCYLWTPALLWGAVVSDAIITLAYFSIPFALMFFVKRRKDLQFNWIFQAFSLFIFSCGITHLLSIWTIWQPYYWLEVLAKELTAALSLFTAVMLWPLIPRALKLPSTKQLEVLVASLEQEVAQRKISEAELIRLKSLSDERFRILFDSTRDALVLLTPDGFCVDGNPAAFEMYECRDVLSLKGRSLASFAPEFQPDGRRSAERAEEIMRLTLEEGSHLFEWMHKRKDGYEFPVEALLTRIQMGEETLLVSNARDISERKKAEQALLEAKQMAEASTRIKSEFLANMSHEIRTPMNAIFGISELVLNQDVSPRVRSYLEKIRKASDSLMIIINDILDFSKIESHSLKIENTSFNLDEIIANLSNLFSLAATEKQLLLDIKVLPDVPRQLLGDALRIQQILTNLLSNAIKFTTHGSVLLMIKLVEETGTDAVLEFMVEDTGIGISEDDLSKLFQPFGQANSSITRRFGGTGLGLVISQQLLKLMGSGFQVLSTPNAGSRFSFTLRLEKCSKDRYSLQESSSAGYLSQALQKECKELEGIRVLVAEDNEINQTVISDILRLCHISVEMVKNGKEVMAKLEQNHFEMVLMDIHMPEMDGIETVQLLRMLPRYADLPVIGLTADVTYKQRDKYLAYGFNSVIIKPYSATVFFKTLAGLLRKSENF